MDLALQALELINSSHLGELDDTRKLRHNKNDYLRPSYIG